MKYILAILSAITLLLAVACSDNEQFRVNGTIEGNPTLNLRIGYYADGAYRTVITAAREGEFEFFGSAASPALIEIMDYEYRPLARLYGVNGETYEVKLDRKDPYAIDIRGNRTNEEWSRFLRDNAEALRAGGATANEAIAAYIAANPSNIISTLLLLTAYDSSLSPLEADSLLALIEPQARPSHLTEGYTASLQRLMATADEAEVMAIPYYLRRGEFPLLKAADSPYTLLTFTNRSTRDDRLLATLRSIHKSAEKKHLKLIDLSLDNDTVEWRGSVRSDSAAWTQGWVAGNVSAIGVDKLAIPALPFYVLCDSTGRQIYRGANLDRAKAVADSILKL